MYAKTKIATAVATALGTLHAAAAHADSEKVQNPDNGHYYQRFDTPTTWGAAKEACANLGAHLATVTSQQENDWILNNVVAGVDNVWLGGTDAASEGTWTWITGEPWNYSYWYPGEPNGWDSEESLVKKPVLPLPRARPR